MMSKYYLVIASVLSDREIDEVPAPKCFEEPSYNYPFIGTSLQVEMAEAVQFIELNSHDESEVNIVFTDFTVSGPDAYDYIEKMIMDIEDFPVFINKVNIRSAVHRFVRTETYPEIRPLKTVLEWVKPILMLKERQYDRVGNKDRSRRAA